MTDEEIEKLASEIHPDAGVDAFAACLRSVASSARREAAQEWVKATAPLFEHVDPAKFDTALALGNGPLSQLMWPQGGLLTIEQYRELLRLYARALAGETGVEGEG